MESYEHRFQGHRHRMSSVKLPSEDLSVEKEAPIWGQVLGRDKPKCKGSEISSGNWEKSAMLLGFPGGANGKEPAWQGKLDKRDAGLIPGSVRSPGGEHGNPLQYSCLENSMDRRAWQATVHRVAKVGHEWSGLAHTHPHKKKHKTPKTVISDATCNWCFQGASIPARFGYKLGGFHDPLSGLIVH